MKLAVCFGGTYEMYIKHAKIIETLPDNFTPGGEFTFTNSKDEIKLFFAFGSEEGKVLEYARIAAEKNGETVPPTSKEVIRNIKAYEPDRVLFFGIAGGLNLPINKICYPQKFCKIFFKSQYLLHEQKIKDISCLNISNSLGKGGEKVLTTNVFLNSSCAGAGEDFTLWGEMWPEVDSDLKKRKINLTGKEAADKWSEINFNEKILPILRSYGDLAEMESYPIAEAFREKIGVMIQISDIPGSKELTFERKHINWDMFRGEVTKNISRSLNTSKS